MPKVTKNQVEVEVEEEEEEITVDMTTAKVLETLDPKRPYLFAISGWTYGKTDKGRTVKITQSVLEPKIKGIEGRTVIETISLANEYTLGRVKSQLQSMGFPEEELSSSKFVMPKEDDVLGMQFTGWVRTVVDKTGQYPDKNTIGRTASAATYEGLPNK